MRGRGWQGPLTEPMIRVKAFGGSIAALGKDENDQIEESATRTQKPPFQ